VRVLLSGRLGASAVLGIASLLATAALASAVPAAAVPAAAAAAVLWSPRVHLAAATRPVDNLDAVAVVSPSDAWAVGTYQASGWAHTLIEHWDGAAWTVTAGPNPGGPAANNYLYGVAATSSSSAWAVGSYRKAGAWHTLIEHWDGTAWTQVASPGKAGVTPGTHLPTTALAAVTALSPSDIWAVGWFHGSTARTLTVHWNGTSWRQVASPNATGNSNLLLGVAATSPSSAWAVGYYLGRLGHRNLIEHWNGTSWRLAARPSVAGSLSAAAASPSSAWAAGGTQPVSDHTVIEHEVGGLWKVASSPNLVGLLDAAAATSATNAWAAGFTALGQPVIEHWNGSTWKQMASPKPGFGEFLYGLAALSASNAWAVGFYSRNGQRTLTEHWNGTAWRQVASPNR
jgi:hypothetical protein